MTKLNDYVRTVNFRDKKFVGTIAFSSEEIRLPDESKMALGIDDGRWVLIYQKAAAAPFKVFMYDRHEAKIFVDQNPAGKAEFKNFKKHLEYFFSHARVEDLATFLPPEISP